MSDSIKVAIKVRPLIKREKDDCLTIQWQVQGNSIAATDSEMKKRGDGGFHFDHIFDMAATNSDVFDTVVRPIVDAGVNGFNGTVFAYGQTSSGKTYTMMGTDEEPGIVPLAVEHMFDAISNTAGREFLLRVSYLEIYKERVNDLLNRDGVDLKVHEDGTGQVIVNCKEEITNCPENVLSLMKKGDKRRRIGETNMNERSSRSHTIFRITIESREAGADSDGAIQVSQLNLVDLAGSERVRQTGATGERFKEGRHINLSLSALGLVIMQLSESPENQKHVNFRDSKLTRLLQTSLGGNAMTAIICAVTPAALEETLCTLSFASRAKSVKNKPQVNEVMSDAALLKRYAKQLAKLNSELEKLKNDNRIAEVEEMESKLLEKDRINQLLEQRIELLKTRIVSGDMANHEETFKCKSRRRRTWGGPGTFKQLATFTPTAGLPTIKEMSPEKSHRKSVIQSVDMMNQTFQTAFADFELELIESERHRDVREEASDSEEEVFITKRKYDRRVKFNDDALSDKARADSSDVTPEKRHAAIQTSHVSPPTPKSVLHESIYSLTKSMAELREFTTLEKQVMCTHDDGVRKLSQEKEQPGEQLQQFPCVKDLMEFTMEDVNIDFQREDKACNTEQQETIRVKETFKEIPELKGYLNDFQFDEHVTLERVIVNLCSKLKQIEEDRTAKEMEKVKKITELEKQCQILKDMEEQNAVERTVHQKAKQKVSELERQIDILKDTEERNIIIKIAHDETLAKVSELEAQIKQLRDAQTLNVTETDIHQQALARISELEKQVEDAKIAGELGDSVKAAYDEATQKTSELEKELQRLKDVEAQNNIVKIAHEEALSKISSLEGEVATLKDVKEESNALKVAHDKAAQRLSEMEEEVRKLKDVEAQSNIAKAAHEEALGKISSLEGEVATLKDVKEENNALKVAHEKAAQKVSELEEEVRKSKDVEAQSNIAKAVHEEALGKISSLEGEVATLKDVKEENNALKVAHEKATQKVSELEEEIRKLKDVEAEINIAKAAQQEALVKVSELEEEVATLKDTEQQDNKVEVAHQEALQKILELEAKIESSKQQQEESLKDFEAERVAMKAAYEETLEKISQLEAQIVALKSVETENIAVKAEYEEAAQKVLELENQVKSLKDIEQQIIAKDVAYEEALGRISELERQVNNIENPFSSERAVHQEASEKLSKLQEHRDNYIDQPEMDVEKVTESKMEIESLKDTEGSMSGSTDDQDTQKTLVAAIADTKEQLSQLEATRDQLAQEVLEMKKEIANLIVQRDTLKQLTTDLCEKSEQETVEVESETVESESKCDCNRIVESNNDLKNNVAELQKSLSGLQAENKRLEEQSMNRADSPHSELNDSTFNTSYIIMSLEDDKHRLTTELEVKVRELQEIKDGVQSLKSDIEKLKSTIYLLTTENMDMSTKLSAEKECSRDTVANLQKTIDELYSRISEVTDAKINLESELLMFKEELESARAKASEACTDEEQVVLKYQEKVDKLTAENIELISIISEKNKELETIKESKSLLYDHECMYHDKVAALNEKVRCLVSENSELSTDLIEKIEENDSLREELDMLKNKLEMSLTNNAPAAANDVDQLVLENNHLRAEVMELKTKVTMLSNENEKFSNNLLEAMEDLNNSRTEKSCNNTFQLSGIFDASVKAEEAVNEVLCEESREVLANKVVELQDKINHLTRLNAKLSELKLSSCSQCVHLKQLNESRRALKLEAKILNHKLEDLQRKFDQKCADTEALKLKANQELNVSLNETSLNASFIDGMNVSCVNETIQHLNNELQTLKEGHDKLSILYKEKCNELEKLHDGTELNSVVNEEPKPKKHSSKSGTRIDEIQKTIDQVRDDIDELKKNSTNFVSVINKFRNEKASLIDEIHVLKSMNEELARKASDNEMSAATATERSQILENEVTTLTREVEEYATREKFITSEKLTLEVELEDLRAEKESKDKIVSELHRTIDELNDCLSSLKNELDAVTSERDELLKSSEGVEKKLNQELELMKKHCEELEVEKTQSVEAEKRARLCGEELKADIAKLQAELTELKGNTRNEYEERIVQLEVLLKENENEKETLRKNVAALEAKLAQSQDALNYKEELNSVTQKFEAHVKESENELNRVNEKLKRYIEENENLRQEIAKLRSIEQRFQEIKNEREHKSQDKSIVLDNEKLSEELVAAKECMIKELKSLKRKVSHADLMNMSAKEIFIVFLQALMSKEEEIVKNMREQFEKDKQKVIEEKRQTADAEKRVALWAKELEGEIEKLQADLAQRETLYTQHQDKICQLERFLKEATNEKQVLREKLNRLESEFSSLQTEFERRNSSEVKQEEAVFVAQKREREAQEAFRKKEVELQSKLMSEKEVSEKRIKDLSSTIEMYKTKNMELQSNIEGLEAAEKQLKNIIEAKTMELRSNKQSMHRMGVELEQLTEVYNEVSQELEERNSKIEEITLLLKNKCDMLSEYKAKLESIGPDYELLKEQVKERKASIERYKDEIEALKRERERQIETIQEKLNSEEVKNVGLNKQLNELHNKNVVLVEELEGLKEKYEQLQHENAKLERKIRNSTSKIKAETEIEELKDLNKRLQNNLEGASNRIVELQENKNQTLKELLCLKNQYELLSQENNELKDVIAVYKSKEGSNSFSKHDDKYDALIQEKNKIALQLEGQKLLLNQKEKELEKCLGQIEELTNKNKELDEELEDYAAVIRERDTEITKMEDKLYSYLAENSAIKQLEDKLKGLTEEKEALENQFIKFKMDTHAEKRQLDDLRSQNEKLCNDLKLLQLLKKENADLQAKVSELENKLELRSNSGGSRCTSPAFETSRRRHSRNELFNQRRQLENQPADGNSNETEDSLRNKIRELELQLVSKNGKIATLEMQIHSENFPYQRKCRDLEEQLLAFRNRNTELYSEIKKLQRAMNDINSLDCETCRRWRINKRDQGCQTIPHNVVRFCSTSSGIIDEHVLVTKLERESKMSRDLCRSLSRQVKQLQQRIMELEEAQNVQTIQNAQNTSVLRPIEVPQVNSNQQFNSYTYSDRQQNFEKKPKSAMKENVPTNLFETTSRSSKHVGRVWSGNQ